MKKIQSLFFLSMVVFSGILGSATPTQAFLLEMEENVIVDQPKEDDFHAIGGKISIQENIDGDVVIVGGDVKIQGDMEQDLMVAAGSLNVNGNVGDDLRVFGGEVKLYGNVKDDVIVRGGKLFIAQDAVIGGDLIVLRAGSVQMNGVIEGNTFIRGGIVKLNGIHRGDLKVQAGILEFAGQAEGQSQLAAKKISIQTTAEFRGDIDYWQKSGILNEDQIAHTGKITQDPELKFNFRPVGVLPTLFGDSNETVRIDLVRFLSSLLILFLILMGGNRLLKETAQAQNRHWLRTGSIGLMFFILTPILAIVLALTLIGIPLSIFILGIYMTSLFLGSILTAGFLVHNLNQKYKWKWNRMKLFGGAVGIFLILKQIALIPLIGPIVLFILMCITFGALLENTMKRTKTN